MKVMDWIEEQVSVALADGRTELTWTTPSGFVVTQKLMKKDIEVVSLQLMGRCKIHVASDSQEVDRQHHKNATSPNLIHSLDCRPHPPICDPLQRSAGPHTRLGFMSCY